jgi:hypothetical protein
MQRGAEEADRTASLNENTAHLALLDETTTRTLEAVEQLARLLGPNSP